MIHDRPLTVIGDTPRTRYLVYSCGATDKGAVRELNEDSFLVRNQLCLWAVADGMGGHAKGDFASETVVDHLYQVRPWPRPRAQLLDVVARLEDANRALREEAARNGSDAIGATVVCLLMQDTEGVVVWAGDSRAYRIRHGVLEQLSRDHSVVEDLVDAGLIRADEAESHPHAHVLTRAVGAADTLDLDFERFALESGDIYILCSDGLTRCVPDSAIRDTALEEQHPGRICTSLVDQALRSGNAKDNVTVVSVMIQ